MAKQNPVCCVNRKYYKQILCPLSIFSVIFLFITIYLLSTLSNDLQSTNKKNINIDLIMNNFDKSQEMNINSQQMDAILGGIVADAASRSLHWVYDKNKMDSIIQQQHELTDYAFLNENYCPYYNIPNGQNSNYGIQLFVGLKSLYDYKLMNNGLFNIDKYLQILTKNLYDEFTSNKYKFAMQNQGNRKMYPLKGYWIDSTMRYFIDSYKYNNGTETGSPTSHDLDAYCITAPLIAYLSMTDIEFPYNMIETVLNAITTSTDIITRTIFLLDILWNIRYNHNVIEIINQIRNNKYYANSQQYFLETEIDAVLSKQNEMDHVKMTQLFGKKCSMPGSFQSSLHSIITLASFGRKDLYKNAILREIRAGGDNCARCCVVGSILGAMFGSEHIPKDWIIKTNLNVMILIDKIQQKKKKKKKKKNN